MRVAITGASRTIGSVVVQGLRVKDAYGLAARGLQLPHDPACLTELGIGGISRVIAGQGGAGLLPAPVRSARPRTQRGARPAAGPAEEPRADYRHGSPDDVAVALRRRVADPFHLTADTPVSAAVIADALGARPVHVPFAAVRAVMPAAWHARLQQLGTGWPGMAFGTARTRLPGWSGA
ncbi:hypothetical protein [Streptomyces phytophilus]|uniref:hypothetical protein n=1 Tax=Streptomyces phytophilus TaxID=722715 RepID=UPI0015EFF909|nr:hypothetical protein [Streptomyces phytophilus]